MYYKGLDRSDHKQEVKWICLQARSISRRLFLIFAAKTPLPHLIISEMMRTRDKHSLARSVFPAARKTMAYGSEAVSPARR